MKRLLLRLALALVALAAAAAVVVFGIGAGWFGETEGRGEIAGSARPDAAVAERRAIQRRDARAAGVPVPKQVLFGDLHVHTTFSMDAFLMSLPLAGGFGARPPADACDFARYCSSLDFWSINDHAEGLTRRQWVETIDSLRQCNDLAGDPGDPDLVSYLGWEWSQISVAREDHYGHKNVVLLGLGDDEIPTRPIGALPGGGATGRLLPQHMITAAAVLSGERGRDFARFMAEIQAPEPCPEGVPVRELSPDCRESTATPEELFEKLADWGMPALVIPHGTAWGMYTPPASSWDKQLPGNDPALQRLVEVYSGHGNSEEYRDWRAATVASDESVRCPEPVDGYLPSCWRAGELIRARCLEVGESEDECARRAAAARDDYLAAGLAGWKTAPGNPTEAWLDSGQCADCFLPSFNYRPASSVQYMLAIRDFARPGKPGRFDFGFIGSSDVHTARPGTGYKEFGRGAMSEGGGLREGMSLPDFVSQPDVPAAAASSPLDITQTEFSVALFEAERSTGFLYTGGLAAVHSAGRSREAIWDAMRRREVYGTSGPRMLLWFDHLPETGDPRPMGSTVSASSAPRFRARALGSFEQLPGCPEESLRGLPADRLAALCLGECYHPSDRRRPVTRVEVVRIRPQNHPDEPVGPLIEDPWRTFPCSPDPDGCEVTFEDPEYASSARDAIYYARAIEAPSRAVHGEPISCDRDEDGRCTEISLCNVNTPAADDCLGETEERAWSSPIFVEYVPTHY